MEESSFQGERLGALSHYRIEANPCTRPETEQSELLFSTHNNEGRLYIPIMASI